MNTDAWQAVALALSTFVQEDAPTIGAALLASAGKMNWRVAFIACFAGIWIGDALLYLLARRAGRPLLATRLGQRFVKAESLARGEAWFTQRGIWALVLSRLVPGLRLPTYLAAGFLRASFPTFLLVTGGAVLMWVAALFLAAHWLGGQAQSAVRHAGGAVVLAGGVMLVGIVAWRNSTWPLGLVFTHIFSWRPRWSRRDQTTVAVGFNPRNPQSHGRVAERRLKTTAPFMRPSATRSLVVLGNRGINPTATIISSLRDSAHADEPTWEKAKPDDRVPSRVVVWLTRWTHWEFWPAWLFYAPVVVNYLWLAIRYRGLTMPTAANPGIFSGGIVGESKMATLDELFATSPGFTAEARRVDRVPDDFGYPLILKPDVGQRGVGVKLIRNARQAGEYIRNSHAPLIAQRYAPGPHEVGIFYYRFPGEARGRIFAITEKIFPAITGDGLHTIEQLVRRDLRARFMAATYLRRVGDRRSKVLPAGATHRLVEAGNHAQGCIFRDGARLHSEELERRIDEISQRLNGFFIGRYDIRYSNEEELRAGSNFQIIELNGAASEATSIYDARNSLRSAYRTLFRQWELVFAIGAANRRLGSTPTALPLLWRVWRQTASLIATYPVAD